MTLDAPSLVKDPGLSKHDALLKAVSEGGLVWVQSWVSHQPEERREHVKRKVLKMAAGMGQLPTLEWVLESEGLTSSPEPQKSRRHRMAEVILEACAGGHIEVVRRLMPETTPERWLKKGVDWALAGGYDDLLKELLPQLKPEDTVEFLNKAMLKNKPGLLTLLLNHAVSQKSPLSQSGAVRDLMESEALLNQAAHGSAESLQCLLKWATPSMCHRAMRFAIQGQLESVKLLLPRCDPLQHPYLMEAANHQNLEAVALLLPHSDPTREGSKALAIAASHLLHPTSPMSSARVAMVLMLLPVCDPLVEDGVVLRGALVEGLSEVVDAWMELATPTPAVFKQALKKEQWSILDTLAPYAHTEDLDEALQQVASRAFSLQLERCSQVVLERKLAAGLKREAFSRPRL